MADTQKVWEMNVNEDFAQVESIWLAGAKQAHTPYIPESFWDKNEIRSSFANEFKSNEQSVTERYVYKDEKGEIQGFIIAREEAYGRAYVSEVYVKTQRQGIATVLFRTLRGENTKFPQLRGKYSRFRSSAYAHNHVSVAWHIRNGFEIHGITFCPHTGLPKTQFLWEKENDRVPKGMTAV